MLIFLVLVDCSKFDNKVCLVWLKEYCFMYVNVLEKCFKKCGICF